jgi:hypothetical protein
MASFLGQLYNREVGDDDVVTVIRFSRDPRLGARPRPPPRCDAGRSGGGRALLDVDELIERLERRSSS